MQDENSANKERLGEWIDVIEETYEAMLAYAAQGLTGTEPGGSPSELRTLLSRTDEALSELAPLVRELTATRTPKECYEAFIEVLEQDARVARAGVQLVLAQKAMSSQLIDNLNAWIHLRALLTDLFVIDEMLG